MKKIVIVLLVVLSFSWISVASAGKGSVKKSPESLVTCSSVDIYVVTYTAISNSVNPDACAQESPCNPCIESLESQGCKIVDLQIDLLDRDIGGEGNWPQAFASFALSCKKP